MKLRPSKRLTLALAGMLGLALVCGLLPMLDSIWHPRVAGVLHFPATRPMDRPALLAAAPRAFKPSSGGGAMAWLKDPLKKLEIWKHIPRIRNEDPSFGDHYTDLLASKNPADEAQVARLRSLALPLYQELLKRYPELAVPLRKVPAERNGFLRWLELSERLNADPARPGVSGGRDLGMPESLKKYLAVSGPWDSAEAKAWLAKEKPLLDEIRSIGLLPEQSIAGIDVNRYFFIPARLAKGCAEALMLEARLAAEEGNAAGALEAVRAAKGLADHFSSIEMPTLMCATVQILVDLQLQAQVLTEIIPALPPGQFDPAAWEATLQPAPMPPAEFARLMKGEWHAEVQYYLLPALCDVDVRNYPADPEDLADFHASRFAQVVVAYDKPSAADWATVALPPPLDTSQLSRQSDQLVSVIFVGSQAWAKGLIRAQHASGMTAAAFAILKGQAPPVDPIHGLPYVWDPVTRKLSPPADPVFKTQEIKPITVPVR